MKYTIFFMSILFFPAIAQSSNTDYKFKTQDHKDLLAQINTLEIHVAELHRKLAEIDSLFAQITRQRNREEATRISKTAANPLKQIYSSNAKD